MSSSPDSIPDSMHAVSRASSTTLHHDNGSANVSGNPSNAGNGIRVSTSQYVTQYQDPFASATTPKSAKSVTFVPTEYSHSPTKRQVRDSTHLIPTPVTENYNKKFHPLSLRLFIALGVPLLMVTLGIGLELGLFLSKKNNGFSVPEKNAISFASQSFLLSVVPTLFVLPVAFAWRELDWYVRNLQPYVVMSKGNAKPEESVLLDYIQLGTGFSMINALKHKHRLVFWSTVVAALTYLFQPLAGAIFSIQQLERDWPDTVTATKVLGLNTPEIVSLSPFVTAAGFTDASAYNSLGDPPFILNGWAIAEFTFPPASNGSLIVNTTAIQSQANCQNPLHPPVVSDAPDGSGSKIIQSTITQLEGLEGCTQSVTFNPNDAVQQYGVQAVSSCNSPGTPTNASPDPEVRFKPVMFWFFHTSTTTNEPEASVVYCAPSIKGFTVKATALLSNKSLISVQEINNYTTANDVFSGDNNGKAFNAVVFNATGNPFISARGTATNVGISGTIFRVAWNGTNDNLQATFDNPNGFLDITNQFYTRHLSMSAKSIYFKNANLDQSVSRSETSLRLFVNPLPGHALALLLIAVGIIGLFVHIFHRRQRRHLYLTNPPGSIATIIAITSHSGIGELLMPYDKESILENKLQDLQFGMDKRTGAIIVDGYARQTAMGGSEDGGDRKSYYSGGGQRKSVYSKLKNGSDASDEAISLLGKHESNGGGRPLSVDTSLNESSSKAAFDAAIGNYPPTTGWRSGRN